MQYSQAVRHVLSNCLMKKMETGLDWPQPTGICKDVLFKSHPSFSTGWISVCFNDLQIVQHSVEIGKLQSVLVKWGLTCTWRTILE